MPNEGETISGEPQAKKNMSCCEQLYWAILTENHMALVDLARILKIDLNTLSGRTPVDEWIQLRKDIVSKVQALVLAAQR